jgi:hypothetical protein
MTIAINDRQYGACGYNLNRRISAPAELCRQNIVQNRINQNDCECDSVGAGDVGNLNNITEEILRIGEIFPGETGQKMRTGKFEDGPQQRCR